METPYLRGYVDTSENLVCSLEDRQLIEHMSKKNDIKWT